LLPVLYSVTTVNLPHGLAAEVYLASSDAGVNQFHLLYTGPGTGSGAGVSTPRVVATRPGGAPVPLRMIRVGPSHYTAYVVFDPGSWRFTIRGRVGGHLRTFSVTRTLS